MPAVWRRDDCCERLSDQRVHYKYKCAHWLSPWKKIYNSHLGTGAGDSPQVGHQLLLVHPHSCVLLKSAENPSHSKKVIIACCIILIHQVAIYLKNRPGTRVHTALCSNLVLPCVSKPGGFGRTQFKRLQRGPTVSFYALCGRGGK